MNRLLEKEYLQEVKCGSNFSYVLTDNGAFLSTEYKVLQSQFDGCFIKCMKMLYNGKIQLFYHTNTLKSFSAMLPTMDDDSFLTITANLIGNIIDVKHNGFLSCRNIDISFDKIFVDPSTHKVSLIYIPVSERIYDDDSTFENEVRTSLVKLISGTSTLSTPKTIQLASDLSNGHLSMENLHAYMKGNKRGVPKNGDNPKPKASKGIKIVALNAPTRVEIPITKDTFVVGKNASAVDGAISFNKMISRVHCRIDKTGTQYTITDLKSANGTYVNKVRLQVNQPYPIKVGDIIRLANSDFQVTSV